MGLQPGQSVKDNTKLEERSYCLDPVEFSHNGNDATALCSNIQVV